MSSKVANKKFFLLAAAMFLLAGCDVEARPSYDKDYLVDGETVYESDTKVSEITNNLRTLVYDKLLDDGSINSEVLNQTLYLLAQQEIGDYSTLLKSTKEEDKALVRTIKARMDDKLYEAVSNGNYTYRNKFDEELFVTTIQQNLPYSISKACSSYTKDYVFLNDSRDHLYDGGVAEDGEAYTADDQVPNKGKFVLSCSYTRYMEDTYLEDVYINLLVEKYLKENEVDSLGRSAGRKINYVAIKENEKHPEAASALVHTFVEKYISNETKVVDLSILEKAWKGIDLDFAGADQEVGELLAAAGFTKVESEDANIGTYYSETLFGDIATNYGKILPDAALSDETQESDFTGSGAYAKETGLDMKKNSLRKQSLSEDELWITKTNNTSTLPSSVTDRLFNLAVANNVHNNLKEAHEDTKNSYVKKVKDVYYLKPASIESNAGENMDCVIYDKNSSSYYIVQIEEAINSVKLRDGETAKEKQYNDSMRVEATNEMAKQYAQRDTYKEKAIVHYLEEANILFHDTDVYEYFKSTYPDAWDEEK